MKYLFLVVCAMLTFPAFADNATTIAQAQSWLNNLDTATAKFQQIDYMGNVMRGRFYIDRPGRLRFEYDAPTKDFIVADGFQIHFYDGESGQTNSAPIGTTMADFILRDKIEFDNNDVTVTSVTTNDASTNITLTQTDEPGMGNLVLKFDPQSQTLKSWDIIDAQGLKTSIVLDNLDQTTKIDPKIFTIDNRNLNE